MQSHRIRMPARRLIVAGLLALLAVFFVGTVEAQRNTKKDRVLMTDVQALTLYKGRKTTGKRSRPVPQFKCIGGDACRDVQPDVIQCRQVGLNMGEPQWRCEAELENLYKFGTTEVICEGYDFAEDPYILAGSCGVEYTLHRTPKWFEAQSTGSSTDGYRTRSKTTTGSSNPISGLIPWIKSLLPFGLGALIPGNDILSWIPGANRFPFSLLFGSGRDGFSPEDSSRGASTTTGFSMPRLIWYIVCGLFTYSVYQTCIGSRRQSRGGRSSRSGGSGGGGGGTGGPGWPGGYDPSAPPYDSDPSPPPYSSHYASHQPAAGGGFGGFWSGLGLASLLAGARSRNNNWNSPMNNYDNDYNTWGADGRRRSPRASTRASSSRYDPSADAASSSSFPSESASSSSSDTVRTTTGYGGTRRR
ncbi:hypothetical protein DFJ77DRAFT_469187 [Powellomyces hirtus]|nr:hypothetical protein DFJ77DRAFT_469187 [Powellomyces hirtus]